MNTNDNIQGEAWWWYHHVEIYPNAISNVTLIVTFLELCLGLDLIALWSS